MIRIQLNENSRERAKAMQKRYLNVAEIAKYLGFTESAIRKWVRLGVIPFVKINGGIRFDLERIERWVEKKYYHEVY
jgi:excisionase family DNA binding protein